MKPNSNMGADAPQTKAVTVVAIRAHLESEPLKVYTITVPEGPTPVATLELARQAGTGENRPLNRFVPPVRPGDIMILDGEHYLVQIASFAKLSQPESIGIQKLSLKESSFGYAFMTKNNLVNP
jgi:hypothetical protein